MGLAENIKNLREQHGLTQNEFAEKLGVSGKAVCTWEKGTRQPRMGVIEKIAKLYNIKKSDIIEDKDTPVTEGERNIAEKSQHDEKIAMLVDLFEMLPDLDQNQVLFQLLNQVRYLQGLDGKSGKCTRK